MLKKLLMILLGKWAKGHAKEVAKAQRWIDSAQAQFASAIEEAEIAEQKFEQVEYAKRQQLEKALEELNELASKKESARKFKEKIKTFIEE